MIVATNGEQGKGGDATETLQDRLRTIRLEQEETALGRALAQLEILAARLAMTMDRASAFGLSSHRRLTEGATHTVQILKFMDQVRQAVRHHRDEVRRLRHEIALFSALRPRRADDVTIEAYKRAKQRLFEDLEKKAEALGLSPDQSAQEAVLQNELTEASTKSVEAARSDAESYLRDDLDWSAP